MKTENDNAAEVESDGTLLPMDAIAVCPVSEEDLANLVAHVPVCMAGALARMAAWRSMGLTCDWEGFPAMDENEDLVEVGS